MAQKTWSLFDTLFSIEPEERQKIFYLGMIFCLIVAGYTIVKDLRDSVFLTLIGKSFQPYAKYVAMLVLTPFILLYSRIVDEFRRYQVLSLCSAFFGIGGLIFAYFLGHPTIGLHNTLAHQNRILGWFLYCFAEGYTPFAISVFWAFANSITSPDAARKNYGFLVSASKIGGMISAGLAWALFNNIAQSAEYTLSRDIFGHQMILGFASLCFLFVPFFVWRLMRMVPQKFLHGYEALYQLEKHQKAKHKTSVFKGLEVLLKYPYVLSIFGMVFFFEAIFQVISYLRLGEAVAQSSTMAGLTSCLLHATFFMHLVAFIISLFGTRALLQYLGVKTCLLLIPFVSSIFIIFFIFDVASYAVPLAFIVLKSLNFAFFWPLRETLYIPAVEEIKFKAKPWIDAFGSRFAKSAGATFNVLCLSGVLRPGIGTLSLFFAPILILWTATAYFLGIRFDRAVGKNEVIGCEELKGSASIKC